MKKFVSAAIVTAMIASMGVSALADVSFGSGASADVAWPQDFGFGDKLTVLRDGKATQYGQDEKISLNPGDTIYMPLTHSALVEEETPETPDTPVENPDETPDTPVENPDETPDTPVENPDETPDTPVENPDETPDTPVENPDETPDTPVEDPDKTPETRAQVQATVPYSGKVDRDWRIKFSAGKHVKNASFYTATAKDTNLTPGALYVKVEMDQQLDSLKTETLSYGVYINENGSSNKTERVTVKADFANVYGGDVSFDFINFVGGPSIWEVKEERSGNAIFDFGGEASFDVTMYDGEKVLLDLVRDYNRDVAIANEDADLEFYNFRGTHDEFARKGILSLPGDKDSYVYELINDKLYELDFDYNKKEGTLEIKTDSLGSYVVSDMELEAKEIAPEKPSTSKPSTDSDKNNPSTGAADLTGVAAALAAVSVAAGAALTFKKR